MTDTHIQHQFSNIADLIEHSLVKFADKPAYSCFGQTLTYADIDAKSKALAVWLQQQPNLHVGDRIVIQLPNINQYPIAAYAAIRAGLVIVNTNPLYTTREMQHQFKDSGAKAIILLQDLLPKLNDVKAKTDIEYVITTAATDLLTKNLEVAPSGCFSFNQIVNNTELTELAPRTANSIKDTCVLQYTGGTTGVSKGACLSHENLMSNAVQTFSRLGASCQEQQEIFIAPLPLYHIYAFTINLMMLFNRGNLNVLIPNPRDLNAFVEAMKPFKFTGISGINTLFVGLCHNPEFKTLDFSTLKLTVSGGTALTSSAVNVWKEVTGCSISEGYGLSETSPVLCLNEPGKEVLGSVGKPVDATEIQLWDENDQVAEQGQIVARGPQVMSGYWNMAEETAKVLTKDGFFKTGDVGVRLENGEIKIVDRLKDMIIVSGFNVYPNEIEDVLTTHPKVLEAAVIGEEDDKTGEKVCAYITLTEQVCETEITQHCKSLLTAYKVPRKVVFMDELPKSTVGKILRRELRKTA
ncbi:AMP-binding protein [Thalassotalea psychrophila]|uniref:Long-chain-fatty-acid--CoA ligase n=1 Tax=Thalassotalea psychrophila TaxID=3065647 RepID=A0ABY9TZD7_9GAMM|nr:AMP-binding protein [Colwelliaceae bacterium SQ149]